MAGTVKELDTVALITVDRTIQINGGGGAHSRATFYLRIRAITRTTGTLEVTVGFGDPSATNDVAKVVGITALGLFEIPKVAPFLAGVNEAIPSPTQVFWNLVGDTTNVSGEILALYGD